MIFAENGDIGIREDEAVEFEFHQALACEATGVLAVGEAPGEVAPAREGGAAKLACGAQRRGRLDGFWTSNSGTSGI